MNKRISISLLLLIVSFQTIYTRIITTDDLKAALAEANPGDTIELKSGYYRDVPYTLKNGTYEKKIKIKSAPNADVDFMGTPSSCIFDDMYIHDVIFEGEMYLHRALCGIKLLNSSYINITGLFIVNIEQQGILISGHHNTIYNNKIFDCVRENRYDTKSKTSGWSQSVAIWGVKNGVPSTYNSVINNIISFSYGESLYFFQCEHCVAQQNEITNGLSANIYIDSSKYIDIDGNILRVNSTEYDNKYGSACGIAMSPDDNNPISYINITNNVILGTRVGIYFFMQDIGGGYNNVRILHNTLWNVHVTPIWFKKPNTKIYNVFGCEMKNNFIYFEGAKEFEPKNAWDLGYNIYYNTTIVPTIYSDTTSKAAKNLTLNTVFNQINSCKDYYNKDLIPDCLRPSKHPDKLQLYHSGTALKPRVREDKVYCQRNYYTPSIGAYEFPEECSGDVEPPTDIPQGDFDVRFNISYCTAGYRVMKLVGSFCNWNVGSGLNMTQVKSCNWTATIRDGTSLEFKYKFVEAIGSSAYKVESDPYRVFKGSALADAARKKPKGIYENCNYTTISNLITLACTWR